MFFEKKKKILQLTIEPCSVKLGFDVSAKSINKCQSTWFNSLPDNKILDRSKLKQMSNDKVDVTKKLKFVVERVENIVGKVENAGYQHFLLFPQCFQKASYTGSLKVGIVW